MDKCLVVNLFGAPGSGKSTGAAYIFSQLKMKGINVELVTEFAKDKVWEHNNEVFKPDNQCYLFGEQFYRMNRCRDSVDVIVTDSPLLLNMLYNSSEILGNDFNKVVMNCFNSFNNLSYMLLRAAPYDPRGRIHTEKESDILKERLSDLLNVNGIQFEYVGSNIRGLDLIVDDVLTKVKGAKAE